MEGEPRTASPDALRTTRRGFLRLAGATTAFATLAQLRVLPADAGAPGTARFFDDWETEVLTQIAERMLETGDPAMPGVRQTGTVASIDRLCLGLDPELSGQLPLALRLFEYAPLLLDLRFSRFTRMSDAEKAASLGDWAGSRLALRRTGFLAVRNLCLLGYYSQPESWKGIGYQGPLLGWGAPA